MTINKGSRLLDSENRPFKNRETPTGEIVRVYCGVDASGIVRTDGDGEYIVVNGEKRYWRGIVPTDGGGVGVISEDVGIVVLKPDTISRGHDGEIRSLLKHEGFQVVAESRRCLTPQEIFRLYPYFFEPDWEKHLLEYLGSDPSICLMIRRRDSIGPLLKIRDMIRLEKRRTDHPVINLLHCADTRRDAGKELEIFFGADALNLFRKTK